VQSVRMHLDGNGLLWAMAKCRVCGEVHKYLVSEALAGPIKCKSCARPMEIQGAVIESALPGDQLGNGA
jgi:hypothetical protein